MATTITTPRKGTKDFKKLVSLQEKVDAAFEEGTDQELAAAKAELDAFCKEKGYYWS